MAVRIGLAALAATISLCGSGCVTCQPPECHKLVHEAGPTCELPRCCRERVYMYLVNGLNPWGSGSLDELQNTLHRHGFIKVGRAGCFQGGWVVGEMQRIVKEDPEARFVLVGYDVGAATVVSAMEKAVKLELPLEAVIFLDPIGQPRFTPSESVRTMLVRSGGGTVLMPRAEIIPVPEANHFDLAEQTATAAAVCGVAEEIATGLWSDLPNHLRYQSWNSDEAPTGVFAPPKSEEELPEWNFLHERVGGVTPSLPVDTVTVPHELIPSYPSVLSP